MKTKLTLLLIYFSFSISAQIDNFSFGAQVFPSLSKEVTIIKNSTSTEAPDIFNSAEALKPSLSFQGFAEYKFTERIALRMGFGYLNNGKRINFVKTQTDVSNPSPGVTDIKKFATDYKLHHIEIPILAKIDINKRLYGLLGISAIHNFYNQVQLTIFYEDGRKETPNKDDWPFPYSKTNITFNAGLGFNYFQNDKLELFVQPYSQLAVLRVIDGTNSNHRFLSFGLVTGIKIL